MPNFKITFKGTHKHWKHYTRFLLRCKRNKTKKKSSLLQLTQNAQNTVIFSLLHLTQNRPEHHSASPTTPYITDAIYHYILVREHNAATGCTLRTMASLTLLCHRQSMTAYGVRALFWSTFYTAYRTTCIRKILLERENILFCRSYDGNHALQVPQLKIRLGRFPVDICICGTEILQ